MKTVMLLGTLIIVGFSIASRNSIECSKPESLKTSNLPINGKIAFTSDRKGSKQIYVMNADGSGLIGPLTTSGENWKPAFSPDGKKIAFVSDRDNHDWEIYVMDSKGNNQTNLTHAEGADEDPCFSPDGKSIAFQSNRQDNKLYQIFSMDISGDTLRRRTDLDDDPSEIKTTNNTGPAWGPGNARTPGERKKQIAFHQASNGEIWVMNEDGSNKHRLGVHGVNVSWSPDGSRITFWAMKDGREQIFVADADGNHVTQVTSGTASQLDPCWSEDGTRIVFQSNAAGSWDIYSIDAAAKLVAILNGAGEAYPKGQLNGDTLLRLTDERSADMHPACGKE